jgi:hypothetical protein
VRGGVGATDPSTTNSSRSGTDEGQDQEVRFILAQQAKVIAVRNEDPMDFDGFTRRWCVVLPYGALDTPVDRRIGCGEGFGHRPSSKLLVVLWSVGRFFSETAIRRLDLEPLDGEATPTRVATVWGFQEFLDEALGLRRELVDVLERSLIDLKPSHQMLLVDEAQSRQEGPQFHDRRKLVLGESEDMPGLVAQGENSGRNYRDCPGCGKEAYRAHGLSMAILYSAVSSRHIFKDAPGLSREVHGQREELKRFYGFSRDACKMPAQRRRLRVEPKSKI